MPAKPNARKRSAKVGSAKASSRRCLMSKFAFEEVEFGFEIGSESGVIMVCKVGERHHRVSQPERLCLRKCWAAMRSPCLSHRFHSTLFG
jgi:hypothetical protein